MDLKGEGKSGISSPFAISAPVFRAYGNRRRLGTATVPDNALDRRKWSIPCSGYGASDGSRTHIPSLAGHSGQDAPRTSLLGFKVGMSEHALALGHSQLMPL